jgi:hypothetical protein
MVSTLYHLTAHGERGADLIHNTGRSAHAWAPVVSCFLHARRIPHPHAIQCARLVLTAATQTHHIISPTTLLPPPTQQKLFFPCSCCLPLSLYNTSFLYHLFFFLSAPRFRSALVRRLDLGCHWSSTDWAHPSLSAHPISSTLWHCVSISRRQTRAISCYQRV